MDIHQNAMLPVRRRVELAQMVLQQGETRKAAAAAFRVSPKTASKWVKRFQLGGPNELRDRSSRPHRCPRQLPDTVVAHIIDLRRQHLPAYRIARSTGVSPASVSRILRRAHLSRWRDLHPRPPVIRYEHPHPGDLLHLDIKGMTRFQEVTLRGDGRLRGKRTHLGFEALHVAIDDHSRMAFMQILPDQKTETTIAFLRAAIEFFATHGIAIKALLTDNGSSYKSHRFRHECARLNIKHRRTRPYSPQTNGKAERLIQTALREWAYAEYWDNSDQRDAHLKPWTDYYNCERPHGSLNFRPPVSRSVIGTTS